MVGSNCEKCKFRAVYDKNPSALLGKLWRWHTSWCPGWKAYMASLPPEEKNKLASQYDMKKFQ